MSGLDLDNWYCADEGIRCVKCLVHCPHFHTNPTCCVRVYSHMHIFCCSRTDCIVHIFCFVFTGFSLNSAKIQIELEVEHQSAPAWVIVVVTATLVGLTTAAVVYGVRWLLHKQRESAYVAIGHDDIELPVSRREGTTNGGEGHAVPKLN